MKKEAEQQEVLRRRLLVTLPPTPSPKGFGKKGREASEITAPEEATDIIPGLTCGVSWGLRAELGW